MQEKQNVFEATIRDNKIIKIEHNAKYSIVDKNNNPLFNVVYKANTNSYSIETFKPMEVILESKEIKSETTVNAKKLLVTIKNQLMAPAAIKATVFSR